jgi:hypothetical protein
VGALDTSLEDLLTRVHEFVGVLDMARGDWPPWSARAHPQQDPQLEAIGRMMVAARPGWRCWVSIPWFHSNTMLKTKKKVLKSVSNRRTWGNNFPAALIQQEPSFPQKDT